MRVITIGLVLLFSERTAVAEPLVSLLQKAGFSTLAKPIPAADFQLPELAGRGLRLHEQRGKVVFLNFWATSCPPCQREMPLMNALYRSLRQQPFVMWAVDVRESQKPVARFVEEYELLFPALLDQDGAVSIRYGVWALPVTYLIDCAGNIVGRAEGLRHWTNVATRVLLAELLSDSRCSPSSAGNVASRSGRES